MNFIISIINYAFDLFFSPFCTIDPIYGLLAISFITTVIMLPIFKYTSNQESIRRTKAKIIGHFLEIRLFKDDIRIVFSAQGNILKYNLLYLKSMLRPLCFVVWPVMIIMIQTGMRYEYRPLRTGEVSIVKVKIEKTKELTGKGSKGFLVSPEGLRIETPPLRVNGGGEEIYWRIKAEKEGVFDLRFQFSGIELEKRVVVSNALSKLAPKVSKEGFMGSFFCAGESLLDKDGCVEFFEVTYPQMKIMLFGWGFHWIIIFFTLSLLFSFLLLRLFRVSI